MLFYRLCVLNCSCQVALGSCLLLESANLLEIEKLKVAEGCRCLTFYSVTLEKFIHYDSVC